MVRAAAAGGPGWLVTNSPEDKAQAPFRSSSPRGPTLSRSIVGTFDKSRGLVVEDDRRLPRVRRPNGSPGAELRSRNLTRSGRSRRGLFSILSATRGPGLGPRSGWRTERPCQNRSCS